ncbi:hypothetical protein ACFV2U_28625 [Streptomyces sp. NPDC059697]|uniref:hypothetical protein n=1 Tax=Streptomyces sp. NPDC059697 TaxID=3346912 RepID=UPI0036BAD387
MTTSWQHSSFADWDDWQLARAVVCLRSMARYSDDPSAGADRRIGAAFTIDEAGRIDACPAAGRPDSDRLTAIEARLNGACDDTKWLAEQLKQAWADLAALIGEEAPRNATPAGFIDLVERVRDVLGSAGVGRLQDAREDLDDAVTHLTDALTSPAGDQRSLLAWARTHLRDAIETAR